MRKNNARAVLSLDDLLRPLRAGHVRTMLMNHRAAKIPKLTYYDEWMEVLNVNRQELDNILSIVVEMDFAYANPDDPYMHVSLIVNRKTCKPGRGFTVHLQRIAERVANAIEQDKKAS